MDLYQRHSKTEPLEKEINHRTASPADTGKASVLNSYVSCPVRLTCTLSYKEMVWIEPQH